MDEFGTIPDMLCWYDGMLLLPEHFQAAHRRQEMLSGYLARTAAPYGWGVKSLTASIAGTKLVVAKLDAVMPDGLAIRYRAEDTEEPALEADLSEHKPLLENNGRLRVHLIVKAWSDDIVAKNEPEPGGFDRYRSVKGARLERDDPDVGKGDAAAEQMRERPWLRPTLKLHVGDDGLTKYVALPIARIAQNNDSKIIFHRYEPPRPTIAGSDHLCDIVEQQNSPRFTEIHHLRDVAAKVAAGLRAKEQFLGAKVQRDRGAAGFRAAAGPATDTHLRQLILQFQMHQNDIENLRALVRPVPRLEALTHDSGAHPFDLYLALCDIVGDLAMLEGEPNLPERIPYDHLDALASFDKLELHIRHMLDSLAQRFRILPFVPTESGRFELHFHPADLGESLVIGAKRAKDQLVSTIDSWMANAAIATQGRMAGLRPRRISGPGRKSIPRDDALDLAPPPLISLFRIDPSPEFIDREDGVIIVENPDAGGPTSIFLYAALDLPGRVPAK